MCFRPSSRAVGFRAGEPGSARYYCLTPIDSGLGSRNRAGLQTKCDAVDRQVRGQQSLRARRYSSATAASVQCSRREVPQDHCRIDRAELEPAGFMTHTRDDHHLNALRARFNSGEKLKYVFFWGHQSAVGVVTAACFSQWFHAPFVVDGVRYATAEHFMMAEKAKLFGDLETRARVFEQPFLT